MFLLASVRARSTSSSNSRRVSRYTREKITTGILPDPSHPLTLTCTAGHPHGTEIFGTHRLARSEVSIATRSRSETGAATVPGPTRTAVNCRRRTRHLQGILYFRRSADCVDDPGGQGVAGSNPVVPTNAEPADTGRNTTSAGLFYVFGRSFWVGDRAQFGTIWGPAGSQEGCQRVARGCGR
jgi:hypothetical protein